MVFDLTAVEARVLGALIEKDITTPEYYPLSLNALVNACNQKSNRDPVMALDEDSVREALQGLDGQGFAGIAHGEGRVAKYEHRLQEKLNLTRGENAILCELLVRGPQTPGELRGRCERMHRFEDIDQLIGTLEKMTRHDPPLVKLLQKQPGRKEARYAHLLSQSNAIEEHGAVETSASLHRSSPADSRVAALESEVQKLRSEVDDLRAVIERMRG